MESANSRLTSLTTTTLIDRIDFSVENLASQATGGVSIPAVALAGATSRSSRIVKINCPGRAVSGRPDMQRIALKPIVFGSKPLRAGRRRRAAEEEKVHKIGQVANVNRAIAVDVGFR